MDTEYKNLGAQVKRNSLILVDRLPIKNLEVEFSIYLQKISHWMETLFLYVAEALSGECYLVEEKIKRWADAFGQRSSECDIPLDHALHFILQSRVILFEFIEEEAVLNSLPTPSLIKTYNAINTLIDLATRTITSHYSRYVFDTKKALLDSNRDLTMTLAELNSLKNALYEATIFSVTDKNDYIMQVNDQFCRISKYDKEELIGQDHGKIFLSGVHSKEFLNDIKNHIKAGKVWNGEICNKAKDGSLYWVDTTIIPLLDDEGVTFQHISMQYDVTEKKKTEEILLKSEKVSLIGELAAGIAHEIRNPLTSIRGLVQLIGETSPEKNAFYKEIISTEIHRINFIVSELMVLAKPHAFYFSWFNITASIKNVIDLLKPEANLRNVIIFLYNEEEDHQFYGERNQLTQVIINLLKNAMEALPDGGTINISVSSDEERLILSIQDNGVGMTSEQKKRLGEPFFTTKSSGTGLGLMVCFRIIQNHKGTIEVESEFKKGTTFKIVLPLHSSLKDHLKESRNIIDITS
jgi:PAS domain S-box-containing protein